MRPQGVPKSIPLARGKATVPYELPKEVNEMEPSNLPEAERSRERDRLAELFGRILAKYWLKCRSLPRTEEIRCRSEIANIQNPSER